ncbi:YiiX/YebB-like N1pC/P60 family cysteine hydrolase [Solimonas sp. SE-A11]|uniref:YiiX/YebB-like N1pC/P60 family cysteine hydrolase n=1 Tax=Solimonas sp. SE-A11 TaxID=3054954 RepID=UPI00259D23E7|nr:YiiX/YebB-like N1pC/P60 family cysteine hydrolase [Solimonas sp. SE-A11]MDM4772399.1 hypothetical protein [Solimonas sp. SE-A11]
MLAAEIQAGDVLLCFQDKKIDPTGAIITGVTKSDYTHAAICVGEDLVVEALVMQGVVLTKATDLAARYDHIAVFRQPDAWSPRRVEVLRAFAESISASGTKYNLFGAVAFPWRQKVHQRTLKEQLEDYFNGLSPPRPATKGSYFCSELVADCFVITGFIDPSAAVLYKAETLSPGQLGRDPTFGTFCGYVSAIHGYAVPATDEFYGATTYAEIFGDSAQ